MLGSNQRPLPCESSVKMRWRLLEIANYLQMARLIQDAFLNLSGHIPGWLHELEHQRDETVAALPRS